MTRSSDADEEIMAAALERVQGVLLLAGSFGPEKPLVEAVARRRGGALVLSADPGSPVFGPPGALSLGSFAGGHWRIHAMAALCTLDAARFRLPLVVAARRLLSRTEVPRVLVVLPGIERGMAGAELVMGCAEALTARAAIVPSETEAGFKFYDELAALGVEILSSSSRDTPVPGGERQTRRNGLWDAYLEDATTAELPLDGRLWIGAPPPRDRPSAWPGRQVALLDDEGELLTMGEVLALEESKLELRASKFDPSRVRSILVRDARRDEHGDLGTDPHRESGGRVALAPDLVVSTGSFRAEPPPPAFGLSSVRGLLVNGVFGDPMIHLRFRHQKRSVLLDLGESTRLPARIVHQVSDVFITHAHFDHIGGFLSFLRSCIGSPRRRRLYGPGGLADHIEGMLRGIHWDRIEDRGPVFEVHELSGERVRRFVLKVGRPGRELLSDVALDGDALLREPGFTVRVATLDHGIPVLAFAFEEARSLHVRKDRLAASDLAPGPWLSEMKRLLHRGDAEAPVELPDGTVRPAEELASELILTRPGRKLAYATDLADTAENRRALVALARHADVLVCEASFAEADRHLAEATQHLTTRACGEIAAEAEVARLIPFHFSKRYEHSVEPLYREVEDAFRRSL